MTPEQQTDSDNLPESEVHERMSQFRQGDVLQSITEILLQGANGDVTMTPAEHGVAIVSQTCDVVQSRVDVVHVARVVTLSEDLARAARVGRRIRYVHLAGLGPNFFADIGQISAIHKGLVASADRIEGVVDHDGVRSFGRAIGRNFSRFAFPDSVSKWLNPLADSIQSKAGKLNSAEGRLLELVVQFRVTCLNGWDQSPYDLRLIVIVKPSALPNFPGDDIPSFEEPLQAWLYDADGLVKPSAAEIADRIEREADASAIYWLWAGLGDAWALRCKFGNSASAKERDEIAGITAEVVSADQFTFTMALGSEEMDLDHLSNSTAD